MTNDKISIKHITTYHSSARLFEEFRIYFAKLLLIRRLFEEKEDEEDSTGASLLNLISMMGDS